MLKPSTVRFRFTHIHSGNLDKPRMYYKYFNFNFKLYFFTVSLNLYGTYENILKS